MLLMSNASKEKLRGGFYTPEPIVNFILRWSVNNNIYDILEPSCGDGVFLKQIKENGYKYNSITAVELISEEAKKARKLALPNTTILNKDFFEYCNTTEDKFDLVIGNPPYIRYQYFNKEQQMEAEKIFGKANMKYSKLTNAWVPFVVGASLLLKEHGKLGFVIPAELLQVSYAKQLRKFLAKFYNKINIISFKKLVFPSIQQEVILLLCEKNGKKTHLIEHLEAEDVNELSELDVMKLKCPKKTIDFESNKWTFYFLEQNEIDFIKKLLHQKKLFNQENIFPIKHYATVEVGITTGANKFFTVPLSTIEKYNLEEYAKPMVGRSIQIRGIIFNKKDWEENVKNGMRAYFLKFPSLNIIRQNKKALEYIEQGKKDGIPKGYKCRIRDEWQIVPSAWVSQALFIRRNNMYPRVVLNQANAYTTDTMHRVTVKENVNIKAFVASYYNSLSFAFAEICGRSYGGGVLELMPNEVEEILIPYKEENVDILSKIDKMMRKGKNIDEILNFTDNVILKQGFGFTDGDIKIANHIWKKLLNRRLNRVQAISIKKGSVLPSGGA